MRNFFAKLERCADIRRCKVCRNTHHDPGGRVTAIEHFRTVRELVGRLVDDLSEEQLFQVPEGFVNTIAWNAAHLVVTQQLLQYGLSGLDLYVPEDVVTAFRKGTGIQTTTPALFWKGMEFLREAPDRLAEDYERGRFTSFNTYETSTGIVLQNIDDALLYNNLHEGIHLGYMMAMKRSLK